MPLIEYRNDRIEIDCGYRDKDRARSIPGARWDQNASVWHYPLAWATCLTARGVFGEDLMVGPHLAQWATWKRDYRVTPALTLRMASDAAGDEDLRTYQRVGVAFLGLGSAALCDDMGTGKTAQIIRTVINAEPKGPVLICGPRSVKRQWVREIAKWGGEDSGLKPIALSGTAAARRKQIQKIKDGEANVLILNPSLVWRHSRLAPFGSTKLKKCEVCDPIAHIGKAQRNCEHCEQELNEIDWDIVVVDEAQDIRNPAAKQTRALWWIGHRPSVRFRWAMTGTPLSDNIEQMWSIMHFVDPDEFPAKTAFVSRYGMETWNGFGGREIEGLNPHTRAELYAIVDPFFIRRPKAAILPELPPKVYEVREVELSAKERRVYRELEEDLVAKLDSGEIATLDPLANLTRLIQASSSMLDLEECEHCGQTGVNPKEGTHAPEPHPDPQFTTWYCWCAERLDETGGVHAHKCPKCRGRGTIVKCIEPSSKLDELVRVLDELPALEPVIVFAVSRQLLDLAAARLDKVGYTHFRIHGGISEADRDKGITEFQQRRKQVALVNIKAGGTGLDGLQVASNVVFLQEDWDPTLNNQSEDRAHRIGQEGDSVNYVFIRAEDTIDESKVLLLDEKKERIEEVLRDADTVRMLLKR